jgi:uncharacterized protein (DUF2062 family)
MGWRRAATYYSHRLKRLPGSPYTIAAGFACGAAVSFTPFIGFHFLLGALLALVLRGNLIASAVGTAVGNPWTFWLIWYAIFEIGNFILGYESGAAPVEGLTLGVVFDRPGDILIPMMVGGLVLAPIVWIIAFLIVRRIVKTYQRLRRQRRRNAVRRRQERRERAARAERKPPANGEYGAQT